MISYLINGSLIAAAGRVSNTVIRPELPSRRWYLRICIV
jgi:hypothetical protein